VRDAEHEKADARVNLTLSALSPARLAELVSQAVAGLPAPIVRRNPTITNPFVRAKMFELEGPPAHPRESAERRPGAWVPKHRDGAATNPERQDPN
jgi:hypothetical protein